MVILLSIIITGLLLFEVVVVFVLTYERHDKIKEELDYFGAYLFSNLLGIFIICLGGGSLIVWIILRTFILVYGKLDTIFR